MNEITVKKLEGMKARERMLAMRNTAPAPAPVKTAEHAPKPTNSKVWQKEQSRPKDAAVFRAAAAILKMTATKDAHRFNVSRQTLSKWMNGETSAPRSAYVLLLDEVVRLFNKKIAKRTDPAAPKKKRATAARIKRHAVEVEPEEPTIELEEHIADALKIMERMKTKGV